jgi:hypothetical protein
MVAMKDLVQKGHTQLESLQTYQSAVARDINLLSTLFARCYMISTNDIGLQSICLRSSSKPCPASAKMHDPKGPSTYPAPGPDS